jgi:hypothetical protein
MREVAFLLYGTEWDGRDAFQEEKYRSLAEYFQAREVRVRTICYCDAHRTKVVERLSEVDYTLVWINPIEAGLDRNQLDSMLTDLVQAGRRLSAMPSTILKLGTKSILYETQHLAWGSDVRQYKTLADFTSLFEKTLSETGARVLKQYRGDGGKGVFKVEPQVDRTLRVTNAADGSQNLLTFDQLVTLVEPYFRAGAPLIDQIWNPDLTNGVVRCYLTAARVAGFGYQEINMLYPKTMPASSRRRHYYTEECGLFQDLRQLIERDVVPQLLSLYKLREEELPILWDADFFVRGGGRYTLCEVNASCVSPFPESAIPLVFDEVQRRCSR